MKNMLKLSHEDLNLLMSIARHKTPFSDWLMQYLMNELRVSKGMIELLEKQLGITIEE